MSVQITFLNHSGFAVETDSKVLVFDYYKDPSGTVKAYSRQEAVVVLCQPLA